MQRNIWRSPALQNADQSRSRARALGQALYLMQLQIETTKREATLQKSLRKSYDIEGQQATIALRPWSIK